MTLSTSQITTLETAGRTIAQGWIDESADLARVSTSYDLGATGDVEYLAEVCGELGLALRGDDEKAIFRAARKGYDARVTEAREAAGLDA